MLKKLLVALTASGMMLSAAACNTVEGAGEDIQSVGQAADEAIN